MNFGEGRFIEKLVDGVWHQIPYKDLGFNDIGIGLGPGERFSQEMPLEFLEYKLTEGQYRIPKAFHNDTEQFIIAAEFEIKPKWESIMDSCIFCNIISRKTEAYIFYENEYVCCFLDKYPINEGHVLIVPKKHYVEFTDVDQESLSQVILAAQKAAAALEHLQKPDGITVMQNNGEFKDVNHYHMHVFPRYKNDGFAWVEPDVKVTQAEFANFYRQLKEIWLFAI